MSSKINNQKWRITQFLKKLNSIVIFLFVNVIEFIKVKMLRRKSIVSSHQNNQYYGKSIDIIYFGLIFVYIKRKYDNDYLFSLYLRIKMDQNMDKNRLCIAVFIFIIDPCTLS